MFVTLKQKDFDSLDPEALGWACFEPTALQIRAKSPAVKAQVYAQLTPGQQALFMFRVLYDHARGSIGEFYGWLSQLMIESSTLSGVKKSLRYFGDEEMLALLEQTVAFLETRNRLSDGTLRQVNPSDLEKDAELFTSVDQLNTRFHELAPATLERVADYIRSHPEEFVRIED